MSDNATQHRRPSTLAFRLLLVVAVSAQLNASCVTRRKSTLSSARLSAAETSQPNSANVLYYGGPVVPRAEAGQGTLWLPFVWYPQLILPEKDSGLIPLDNLFLRDPRLVLRNIQTKNEILIELKDEGLSQSRKYDLRSRDPEKSPRFYLPRLVTLTPGDYIVESIRLEIGSVGQDAGTVVNMPFVNPFHASAAKPLIVSVREGKVSAVSRIVQTTALAQAAQGLSLKSSSESLDRDVIPVDLVLNHLGESKGKLINAQSIAVAATDFPRLRLSLTDEQGNPTQADEGKTNLGFLVDTPCLADGTLRLVWKKQNDEREFLTQFPMRPRQTQCNDRYTVAYSFTLPNGDWVLKSSMIAESQVFQPDVQTEWLRQQNPLLREYFSMFNSPFRWTLETTKEREIRRPLLIPFESLSRRHAELRTKQDVFRVGAFSSNDQKLFLGHFEIRSTEAKNDKTGLWEIFLRPSFSLESAQSLLSSKNIYNAYTLERLSRGRSVKVNTVMRTASDQEDLPTVKTIAAEFRGEASKAFASCLQAREEADPLVNMGGELRFTVLKGGDSVTVKRLKIGDEGLSDKWVESCLEKKLLGFRFSRKVPANFQGELKFSSD